MNTLQTPIFESVVTQGREVSLASRPKYAMGFAFDERHHLIALIQKNRPTWQAGKLNAIGGHIEAGETALEAVVREFEEETSVKIQAQHWDHFATIIQPKGSCACFRTSSEAIGFVKTMTDEIVSTYHVGEIVRSATTGREFDVMRNLSYLIPMAMDLSLDHTPLVYVPTN